jgi:hypothetical protein
LKRSAWLIAGMGAILLSPGMAPRGQAQAPSTVDDRTGSQGPAHPRGFPEEVIILNNASDIGEFWKKLKQPDLILIKPGTPSSPPAPATAAATSSLPRDHVVNAVKIQGRVDDDLADLDLEIDLGLLAAGQAWVPLGIDTPIISSAREGERELELRSTVRGQWEARLEGKGPHRLRFELKLPVNVSPDRKQLTMAIPLAPSTSFELDVSRPVNEVEVVSGGSVGKTAIAGGKGTRLSAHLAPRSRLTLDWTDEAKSGSPPPPLLAAQVEIAIDADLEAVTTRSSWVIRCVRGIARRLEIRLDEQDVVLTLKLDDQFLVAGIERNVLTIPLGEPLRPGETRHLLMETRRTFPPAAPKTFAFSGFPLSNAAEQSGAIGITQSANLWINVNTAQALHRIDPRELPTELRARPGTGTAYQFLDQPFKLGLAIEYSPPLYRSETSSRVVLDAQTAQIDTTLEVQRVRGRLFELEILVPPGLQLISVGPTDLVESAIPIPGQTPAAGNDRPHQAAQVLKIHLTPLGRDLKSFSLRLRGQQRIGPAGEVKLGLFAPRDGVSTTSSVSVFAERDVTFEPGDEPAQPDGSSAAAFHPQPPGERSAANVASGPGERSPIAVLKSNQNPIWLRGRLTRHPLSITHDTRISAQLSRRRIDIRQDTELRVRHGSISSLTVLAPLSRSDAWQVQGKETIRREELDQKAGDSRRYRLFFDPPIAESSLLAFRFQVPVEPALTNGDAVKSMIPWILVEEGTSGSTTVELAAAPGIKPTVDDAAWIGSALDQADPGGGNRPLLYRLSKPVTEKAGFPFSARLLDEVSLPPVVVPRALLRTVLGVDDESRTHAWYWIESHPSSLSFSLPGRAQWIRARIDGRAADQVEHEPSGEFYRLSLPPESQSKPVLVELEYQLSGTPAGQACAPPELPAEAVVLQTLWEIQVPWSQAVIGVPRGWADENDWHWDVYVWKRRPWRPFSKLVGWVAGAPAQTAALDDLLGEEQDSSHGYLFGRSGKPVPLSLSVASRAAIIAVCSGSVLLLGFLLMFSRARFRVVWVVAAVLGLLGSALAHPSVLLLVVQSAMSGVVLTLLGLLIQRLIERARSSGPPALTMPTPGLGQTGAGASQTGPDGVGSDDSTAIRARASSTMNYAPAPLMLTPEQDSARSSRVGQSG